jgi:3-phenylpropionate/trans-cinnamate dioxygenase ferredoxin reductase subunit
MQDELLIIGGSYAASEIAVAARQNGYDESIRILTEENELPYHRPPLSKGFLLGNENSLPLKSAKFYHDKRIDFVFGTRVSEVDLRGKKIATSSGGAMRFGALAFATGARARRLQNLATEFENFLYLRSSADARLLKSRAESAREIVIIGGGFIGLEVASALCQKGKSVTVVEAQKRILARAIAAPTAEFLARAHARHGVQILTETSVVEIKRRGSFGCELVLNESRGILADLVVVGIGSQPNLELAQDAGIVCRDGIVVDQFGRTSHEGVVAAGDCAFYCGPYTPKGMRLESVQNALDQSRSAGAMLAGVEKPYYAVPWFWSDQYELKLQIAGISTQADSHVVRTGDDGVSVFHFSDDACIAVETINRAREHMLARRILPQRSVTRQSLVAVDFALEALN